MGRLARTSLVAVVILASAVVGMACGTESAEDTPTAESTPRPAEHACHVG